MASPSAEREEEVTEGEDLPSARSAEEHKGAARPDREATKTQARGPYRVPGVRDEGPVVETPKDRTAAMIGFAALGGIALLVVVRSIAMVPVVQPPEPEGLPISVAALSPSTAAEVIMAAPAPSMMVQSRAEEVALSMASERSEFGTIRALLLPKVATLDCGRLRTLRQACYATKDSKCLSEVWRRRAVASCPATGP